LVQVTDAIILAGGIGTRMLPASLYSLKEGLPLVDTPILNHLVWEAAKSGVSRIHIVLSKRKKKILEDFFQAGTVIDEGVRNDLPPESLRLGVPGVEIIPHIQHESKGVGDAISTAMKNIKGPFLVLLGDMVLIEEHHDPSRSGVLYASSASERLVESFKKSGLPCVGVFPVKLDEVCNYGVVGLNGEKIISIIEKPDPNDAPSNYVLCGRYLFPENTKQLLDKFPSSAYGELQSIIILGHLIENSGLNAVKMDEMEMYDSGNPILWLKCQIDHSLRRKDLGSEMRMWLARRLSQQEND